MGCNGLTITGLIASILLFILSVSITISGVLGYFDTTKSSCQVTSCNNTMFFYQGKYKLLAHIFVQNNQDSSSGVVQTNADWYDINHICTEIPAIVDCYGYQTCGIWSCSQTFYPVRQLNGIWGLFGITVMIPIAIFVFTMIGIAKKSDCSCNSCHGFPWKPFGKWLTVGGISLGVLGIIALMTVGILGFLDNIQDKCLDTDCTLQQGVVNSAIVNITKVTIQLTTFDSMWHLQQPTYNYLDNSKSSCSQVGPAEQCFYQINPNSYSLSNQRIQSSIFGMLAIPMIMGLVAVGILSCIG